MFAPLTMAAERQAQKNSEYVEAENNKQTESIEHNVYVTTTHNRFRWVKYIFIIPPKTKWKFMGSRIMCVVRRYVCEYCEHMYVRCWEREREEEYGPVVLRTLFARCWLVLRKVALCMSSSVGMKWKHKNWVSQSQWQQSHQQKKDMPSACIRNACC